MIKITERTGWPHPAKADRDLAKTGSDPGLGFSSSPVQTTEGTLDETETSLSVPLLERTGRIEMGLTFPHLHSTYCLFVPLSASLPSRLAGLRS